MSELKNSIQSIKNRLDYQMKEKYHVISLIWIQRTILMDLFTKQKETHRFRGLMYGYRGEGGMRDRLGVWDLHTTILKIDNQEVPTV